ncbi:hypothetical protein [Borrelia sp. A-FGy1]|nr:hypothetical protein [Borrelia sp. A-FGy1]
MHLIYGIGSSINTANLIYFLHMRLIRNCNLNENQKLLIYEFFHNL